MKAYILVLSIICFVTQSAAEESYRNWPQWGKDEHHSRMQTALPPTTNISLCALEAEPVATPTSSSQIVVYDGVQYYVKAGTMDLIAEELDTNVVVFTVDVANVTHNPVNGDISIAVHIWNWRPVVLGLYSTHNSSVLFLVNSSGTLFWNSTSEEKQNQNATGIVVHSESLILLQYDNGVEAIELNITETGTITYKSLWLHDFDSPSVAILSADSKNYTVVLDMNSQVTVLSDTGVLVTQGTYPDSTALVFADSPYIALATRTGGYLLSFTGGGLHENKLDNIIPLAIANATAFIGYHTSTMAVVRAELTNGTTPALEWSTELSLTGLVTASIDSTGLLYVLAENILAAFDLVDGKFVWQLASTARGWYGSPILVSSLTHSYLLVESHNGVQAYKAACEHENSVCNRTSAWLCTCHVDYYGDECGLFCQGNITCNWHGHCDSTGACICDSNYFGPECYQYCYHGDPKNLTTNCFNGTCNMLTGACDCHGDKNYGDTCAYCDDNITCGFPNGTCNANSPYCDCTYGGFFSPVTHGGIYCNEMTNIGFIAFLIGAIAIVLLCTGFAVCCGCESSRKVERDQFSLLTADKRR